MPATSAHLLGLSDNLEWKLLRERPGERGGAYRARALNRLDFLWVWVRVEGCSSAG